jgi:hypothetical protein
MIVKILGNPSKGRSPNEKRPQGKPSKGFPGVTYNTTKVEKGKGELLRVANFGALKGLSAARPQDYINYLQMLSAQNKRVEQPQFHVVFSSKGDLYNKQELSATAEKWLREMGYGDQPYLLIFHRDTANNHVHAVTSRIGRDGKKINSAFERVRAIQSLDRVLGYEFALTYKFSTNAQFYLLLETQGFIGKDFSEDKLQARIDQYQPDKIRQGYLRQLFEHNKSRPDLITYFRKNFNLEITLHAAEGKKPYGYSVIDHETKQVFKGSEILSLRYLYPNDWVAVSSMQATGGNAAIQTAPLYAATPNELAPEPVYIRPLSISDDIDDEAILGRNRRRKKKARTNTR